MSRADELGQGGFAVVTGGSSGIGRELARQFASHGYDVLITSENGPQLEEAAADLRADGAQSVRVETFVADLTRYDEVDALANRIKDAGRPLDAIALNAGFGVGGDFVRTTMLADELRCIELNVASTVHLAKRVLPGMLERNKGRVLITASIDSVQPAPYEAVYGATKAFLLMFSEAIREELKQTEVSITAVMPGVTGTEFFDSPGFNNTAHDMVDKGTADKPADVARRSFDAMMANKDRAYVGSFKWRAAGVMSEHGSASVNAVTHRPLSEPHDLEEVESKPPTNDAELR